MLKIGFARLDITPPLGTPLTGYYRTRYADGILDPLELNAIALSDGEKSAVWISTDLILIDEACSTEIREKIARETGLDPEAVMIHCLHQHTAPHVGKGECIPMVEYLQDAAYLDLLYRKLSDAARLAISDLSEASASTACGDTPVPLSFIRRFRMKDGSTRTNPGRMNPDVLEPIGEADNSLRLIRFRREAGDVALVAFSTHQDTVGGNQFSADWGGALRRMAEKALPGVKVVAVSGFQGDVNHIDVSKPKSPQESEDPRAHAFYMAEVMTETLLSLWDKTVPVEGERIWYRQLRRNVPTNTVGIERAEEAMEIYRKSMNKTLGYKLGMGGKADMGRMATLPSTPLCQKLVVSLLGIGDAAILGVGGEPFTHYALEARGIAGEHFLMTACLVNGGEAYFPTVEAYEEGGYEARTSRMSADCAPMLSETTRRILEEFQNQIKD